jgi:hypothetical protein
MEVLKVIIYYLDPSELVLVLQCSKETKALFDSKYVWHQVFKKYWNYDKLHSVADPIWKNKTFLDSLSEETWKEQLQEIWNKTNLPCRKLCPFAGTKRFKHLCSRHWVVIAYPNDRPYRDFRSAMSDDHFLTLFNKIETNNPTLDIRRFIMDSVTQNMAFSLSQTIKILKKLYPGSHPLKGDTHPFANWIVERATIFPEDRLFFECWNPPCKGYRCLFMRILELREALLARRNADYYNPKLK